MTCTEDERDVGQVIEWKGRVHYLPPCRACTEQAMRDWEASLRG